MDLPETIVLFYHTTYIFREHDGAVVIYTTVLSPSLMTYTPGEQEDGAAIGTIVLF